MAETFESQLMGTQAVRPTNPSVIAGAATAEVASVAAADDASTVFGDAHLQDNFDGIDWSRLPRFMIPPTNPRSRRSWIYRHGYRVALISDPSRVFFICHYCHARKIIDCGGSGAFETTLSTSCSARHLEARKAGHGHRAPGRPAHFRQQDSYLRRAFNAADGSLSQATANSLSGFNTQRFRLAAVRWLVENNHPLREFETPAFQQLIAAANPDAERALWAFRTSVSSFVMRLYDHMFPRVVADLSESISKIHISFDGWTTKGGKQGYLGMVAHYVNPCGELKDLPIALPQLMGDHSGVNTANVILRVLEKFGITSINMGYTVLDNASNNDTTVDEIAEVMGFNAAHRRLRCGPHTLNLIGQTLLWGKDSDAFDNDVRQHTEESESMKDWRRDGPLGVLLAVIKYIKTPQQYALFTEFQRLANSELPADAPAEAHKILQPVKPVVTRWNSYYSCFERAIQLQSAVTAYAESHISRVRAEDSYAASRRNKLPDAQPWMRSTGLRSADWQVVT
jgi:hypothetical protein